MIARPLEAPQCRSDLYFEFLVGCTSDEVPIEIASYFFSAFCLDVIHGLLKLFLRNLSVSDCILVECFEDVATAVLQETFQLFNLPVETVVAVLDLPSDLNMNSVSHDYNLY